MPAELEVLFLGTRANIEGRSDRHRRHSSALIMHDGGRVRIDCGADWASDIDEGDPDAIFLTHAHPDHAEGLSAGSPVPVYAPQQTWDRIDDYPIEDRHTVALGRRRDIRGMHFLPLGVEHSTRAPSVGVRIEPADEQGGVLFYVPDVVGIPEIDKALDGVDLYIGDGAALSRSLVRNIDGNLIGHTTVSAQIKWCARHGVPRALFTHCGNDFVEGDENEAIRQVRDMGRQHGVDADVAYDGLRVRVRQHTSE